MMGDDGEKFGAWPTTWEHCWGSGRWVDRFFDLLDENVVPREKQETIRKVLEWYRANHPVWFDWIELAGVPTPRI